MTKFKKKLSFSLIIPIIGTLSVVAVACNNGSRASEFEENRLALLSFFSKEENKKDPTVNLQKFSGKINIPLELQNFRADVLWCVDAFEPPASVTENGKTFKYFIESVNHILGTTRATITIGVTIDGFVNSNNQPAAKETYRVTMDGFKETPTNHNHWVKREVKDTCEVCLTFNRD